MTSWHTEQQDGKPYYMPQCDVCGFRYDEYGLYEDKEQAAADAVNDGWQAPADAWTILYDLRDRQRDAVDAALDFADTMPDDAPSETVISYYRSQAQYDACHPDGGLYTVANATARAIGMALELDDRTVRYEYPHEQD